MGHPASLPSVAGFGERLIGRVRELGHPLCVGIDPHLDRIPALFRRGAMTPGHPDTAAAVESFCLAILDRVADQAAAVKPQSAFFEALGPPGIEALAKVVASARERGVPVILDAKRGDVGSTAAGYAAAYLTEDAPIRADALTVNPYLGRDSLEPFTDAAEAAGAGLFVLVKTSNLGSGDLQDRDLGDGPVFAHVASMLRSFAERLQTGGDAWSSLGVVVGGTWPEHAKQIREILPTSPFLVPGYGAQSAEAADALSGFVREDSGAWIGGVVSASRSVLFPRGSETDVPADWDVAIDAALKDAIRELRSVRP